MEKELLQKALDSILHGSTQVITETDQNGYTTHREIRINDLRVELVNKIAEKLVKTDGFGQALEKAFTSEVLKKITDKMITEAKWSDLPYNLSRKIQERMIAENVEMRKFKMVIEAVEKDPPLN